MCKSSLHPFIAALPKVEQHLHLEGCISPAMYLSLCKRNSITPPSSPEFASVETLSQRYTDFSSLDDFLHYYGLAILALQTARDYEELAAAYFARVAEQGVQHAELFFDPQAHTTRGVDLGLVIDAFTKARKDALDRYGITSELIPCLLRHLSTESAEQTYESLVPWLQNGTLAGLGACSSEAAHPAGMFAEIFQKAQKAGFRRTAHAGEECGPDYVWAALNQLHVQRVDHGLTIAQDQELLRHMAEQKTLVTLCPLSNVCLKGVATIADLPVRKFLDAGLRFSLNGDDPEYFGGYILENYCAVQEAFDLTKEEWRHIVGGSIDESWCSEERKAQLRKALTKCT